MVSSLIRSKLLKLLRRAAKLIVNATASEVLWNACPLIQPLLLNEVPPRLLAPRPSHDHLNLLTTLLINLLRSLLPTPSPLHSRRTLHPSPPTTNPILLLNTPTMTLIRATTLCNTPIRTQPPRLPTNLSTRRIQTTRLTTSMDSICLRVTCRLLHHQARLQVCKAIRTRDIQQGIRRQGREVEDHRDRDSCKGKDKDSLGTRGLG